MQVEPKSVIRVLNIIGKFTSTWPQNPNLKLIKKKLYKLLWIFSFLNVIGLLIPLLFGVYYNQQNAILIMKALSEFTALVDVFFNLILCKLQKNQLHGLLSELSDYVNSVRGDEKVIFRRNINRYFAFWAFIGLSYFQTAIAFSCGPFFMKQILPADAWYPFSIETFSITYYIIYIQQVFTILQTGMCITVDFMVAMLLCYLSTKLEVLNSELETVNSINELKKCIHQHQSCIEFADKLANSVRFIILKSNATMAMAVIFGAFPILNHEPFAVTSQFILMVVAGCLRLYVTAWPADSVREMSEKIGRSVYNSPWISNSLQMRNLIMITTYRAQKPLIITVKGILPALTLKYYASFLSSTLSYFMTLRTIVGK